MELKNKSPLVTGADGFIGSRLVEELVPLCGAIIVLSQYNSYDNNEPA